MRGSIVEEQVLRPRRKLLVALVEVATVVAEGSRAFRSVADGPDGRAPDPAVCASPGMAFPTDVSQIEKCSKQRCAYPSCSPLPWPP
jgi:hypothetical protein